MAIPKLDKELLQKEGVTDESGINLSVFDLINCCLSVNFYPVPEGRYWEIAMDIGENMALNRMMEKAEHGMPDKDPVMVATEKPEKARDLFLADHWEAYVPGLLEEDLKGKALAVTSSDDRLLVEEDGEYYTDLFLARINDISFGVEFSVEGEIVKEPSKYRFFIVDLE